MCSSQLLISYIVWLLSLITPVSGWTDDPAVNCTQGKAETPQSVVCLIIPAPGAAAFLLGHSVSPSVLQLPRLEGGGI